jgi:hypothetical protein
MELERETGIKQQTISYRDRQIRLKWRDIIEVQRANTQKVIESKKEQGGVCNAQI